MVSMSVPFGSPVVCGLSNFHAAHNQSGELVNS